MSSAFGVSIPMAALSVHADSSAAIGICRWSGIGRVRHLAVGQLWVQVHLKAGTHKVWGERNPADLCTKLLARPVMDHLLALTGAIREPGRDATATLATAEVERIPCVPIELGLAYDSTSLAPDEQF